MTTTDDSTPTTNGDTSSGPHTARRPNTTGRPQPTRRRFLAGAGATAVGLALGGTVLAQSADRTRTFTVRIENVSDGETLQTTADGDASTQAVPLSPGAWAVHSADEPIFSAGHPERNNGLEEIAEDGSPARLAEALAGRETVLASGPFTTPVGADGPGPLLPGGTYRFAFDAASGRPALSLSFVTMFVPSNDLFFAPGPTGLPLFGENGQPTAGDVTDRIGLWDAGTEINEEPGVGANQVQRQRGAGVGLVERGSVAHIDDVNGYDYPAVADVLRVRLTSTASN